MKNNFNTVTMLELAYRQELNTSAQIETYIMRQSKRICENGELREEGWTIREADILGIKHFIGLADIIEDGR